MKQNVSTGFAISIIVILAAVLGGVFWMMGKSKEEMQPREETHESVESDVKQTASVQTSPVIMQDDLIEWHEPVAIEAPKLFNDMSGIDVRAWEVGKEKGSPSLEEKVIFVAVDTHEPGGFGGYVFTTNTYSDGVKFIPYQYSSSSFLQDFGSDSVNSAVVRTYWHQPINSLKYPGFLSFDNMVFQFQGENLFGNVDDPFFHPERFSDKYRKIRTDAIYGDMFLNVEDGGLYVKHPTGIAEIYALKMDFFKDGTPRVIWNDASENEDDFSFKGADNGCGPSKYADNVSDVVAMGELEAIGKTSAGDIVYGYKDKNTEYLKKWYQENVDFVTRVDSAALEGLAFTKDTSYDAFTSNHLVFFWKDPMGRLTRFINMKYVLGGGCGKPVIYLYPERKMNVSVQVVPAGGMTVSDPAYHEGWKVEADPQGHLKNISDGKTHPYLFWEGRGDTVYQRPQNGFVVASNDLDRVMGEKLAQFGLIDQEIRDFKEFWVPRMLSEDKPFYFVTFIDRKTIDALAPLKIDPRPDTVIRVLMDYEGLDAYKNVPEMRIKTMERKGFTAVEWGGVLR